MSSYNKHTDDHASFLQRKKEEILARKNKAQSSDAVKPPEQPIPTSSKPKVAGSSVPFANDGSFLERFKAMQQQKQSSATCNESKDKVKNKSEQLSSIKSSSALNIKKEPHSPPPTTSSKQSFVLKKPAAIFENEVEEVISSDYDVAKQLAERVAAEGLHVEQEARQAFQRTGDSRYRFLFDTSNPVAKYYQDQLKVFKQSSKKRKWDDSPTSTSSMPSSSSQPQKQFTTQSGSSTDNVDITSEFEKAKALVRAKAAALMSGQQVPGVMSEEEKKREKDIEEQRMMQEIYRKVIAQQAAAANSKSKKRKEKKPKYEYDSDEEIDGGTWEHKKRQEEMMKTQEWAMDLTSNAKGKHHLSDFLPEEELEKFMEKVQAVREGREADFSDYSKYRIQADNIGFKMLQKAGWNEGEGLGANKEGITQPINKGKTSFDQAGVGMEKPAEVKKDDDDFELYRKRMMLAYKFRPNPLNNPRRPYY